MLSQQAPTGLSGGALLNALGGRAPRISISQESNALGGRSARSSISRESSAPWGGEALARSLQGRGPLTASIAVRQSTTFSQRLEDEEQQFARLLAAALPETPPQADQEQQQQQEEEAEQTQVAAGASPTAPGDGQQLQGGLAASHGALSPQLQSVRSSRAASQSPSRRVSRVGMASGGEQAIIPWGSGIASMIGSKSFRRSVSGAPTRTVSTSGPPTRTMSMAAAAEGAAGAAAAALPAHAATAVHEARPLTPAAEVDEQALLDIDLLEGAEAQVLTCSRQADRLEEQLGLPRSSVVLSPPSSAVSQQPQPRQLLPANSADASDTAAEVAAASSASGAPGPGAVPLTASPASPARPHRRYTLTHVQAGGTQAASPAWGSPSPEMQHVAGRMDVLGRRASAPGDVLHAATGAVTAVSTAGVVERQPAAPAEVGGVLGSRTPSMGVQQGEGWRGGGALQLSRQQSKLSAGEGAGTSAGRSAAASRTVSTAASMTLEEVYRVAQGEPNPLRAGLQRQQQVQHAALQQQQQQRPFR